MLYTTTKAFISNCLHCYSNINYILNESREFVDAKYSDVIDKEAFIVSFQMDFDIAFSFGMLFRIYCQIYNWWLVAGYLKVPQIHSYNKCAINFIDHAINWKRKQHLSSKKNVLNTNKTCFNVNTTSSKHDWITSWARTKHVLDTFAKMAPCWLYSC